METTYNYRTNEIESESENKKDSDIKLCEDERREDEIEIMNNIINKSFNRKYRFNYCYP